MADDRTPADEETPQEPTAGEEQEPTAAEQPAGEEQPVAEEPAAAEEPAGREPAPAAGGRGRRLLPRSPPPPKRPRRPSPSPRPRLPPRRPPPPSRPPTTTTRTSPLRARSRRSRAPTSRSTSSWRAPSAATARTTRTTTASATGEDADDVADDQPIAAVTIDLAAGARYSATGKRKTAVARVILRPGTGAYTINGRTLDEFFPRTPLQRNIRQPLEAVGYETRMDVVARMHGGGVSSQAGALRHGISRALLEADPNLRGELKRRGFLTRDPRVKERKKAGLKKARKRPQFSKR